MNISSPALLCGVHILELKNISTQISHEHLNPNGSKTHLSKSDHLSKSLSPLSALAQNSSTIYPVPNPQTWDHLSFTLPSPHPWCLTDHKVLAILTSNLLFSVVSTFKHNSLGIEGLQAFSPTFCWLHLGSLQPLSLCWLHSCLSGLERPQLLWLTSKCCSLWVELILRIFPLFVGFWIGWDKVWFGWTPGVGDGQGGLAHCGSWSRKESDATERLIWTEVKFGCKLSKSRIIGP